MGAQTKKSLKAFLFGFFLCITPFLIFDLLLNVSALFHNILFIVVGFGFFFIKPISRKFGEDFRLFDNIFGIVILLEIGNNILTGHFMKFPSG